MLQKFVRLVFPAAVAVSLAACGGAGIQSTPSSGEGMTAVSTPSATSYSYGNAVLADNPSAFYELNDPKPTAHDDSGHSLNGAIGSSIATQVSGLATSSTAMAFPGMQSAPGAVSVAPNSLLQPSSRVSLEALFKFSNTPADYSVLAAYGQRSGTASYELFIKGGKLVAQFALTSGYAMVTSAALLTNVTYDAVATYDGSTARLYVNGNLVGSMSKTGALAYAKGYGFSIGDDASYSTPGFKGVIGGIAVFPSALSASSVSAHYAAVSGNSPAGKPTPKPTPKPSPTATPRPTATPSSAPSGTVVWQAGDPTLGKWLVASGNQCGTPVNSGTSFTFNLRQSGTSCGRNQATPVTSAGTTLYLQDGHTYTWTFHYIDGTPSGSGPGMGLDTGSHPDALIWQIHGTLESDTPCTSLNFVNGQYYSGSVGTGQQWAFATCRGFVWFGKYVQGESDDWKIVATIANANLSSETYGETKLYRNGVLVADDKGPNYHNSGATPESSWFNFGPYKWRWNVTNGGSNMTQVNATINNLTLTRQ